MIEAALTGLGAALFVLAARSWRDLPHLVYDTATGLVTASFIVKLIFEGVQAPIDASWIARVAMVVLLAVATAGRIIRDWPVSGHLSFVLAIAVVQLTDARLPWSERLAYVPSVPLVFAIRWWVFDQERHAPTYAALVIAACCAAIVLAVTTT